MTKYQKILGGLLAGAVGDAMGAATETRNMDQIVDKFGGLVTDFVDIPDDVFARGCPKGFVTDDFSLAYYTAWAIINNKGVIDENVSKQALVNWSQSPYITMAGPTTMAAINKLKGDEVADNLFHPAVENGKGTNGSAMKIAPVGFACGTNVNKAIKEAVTICKPTHYNNSSLAAACAVAGAVSAAMKDDADISDVMYAAFKGAQYGETQGVQLANPSVYRRIKLAFKIGVENKGDLINAAKELNEVVGSGLAAYEAVPAAFGLLVALDANPVDCIVAAVNMGNDTDTVATIVGAIAGTLNGYYDERYLKIIDEVNGFDLRKTARELALLNE
ncbi:MAG: ADP-ribosylglycohydrolase family protein [Erysipelotrichaceae bacterium]